MVMFFSLPSGAQEALKSVRTASVSVLSLFLQGLEGPVERMYAYDTSRGFVSCRVLS